MRTTIMCSKNGNFTLCKREGVGMNDTPFTQLEVISSGDAEKYIVEIRLKSDMPSYIGKPVKYSHSDCNISYGLRNIVLNDSDIKEFIEVLNEALEFETKIRDYLETVGNDY